MFVGSESCGPTARRWHEFWSDYIAANGDDPKLTLLVMNVMGCTLAEHIDQTVRELAWIKRLLYMALGGLSVCAFGITVVLAVLELVRH
jgi:hypothetical protein